jgi:hypothetical protein
VKTSTSRVSPLTAKLPMAVGAEKHMDVEIRFLSNFVNARYDILPMLIAFLRYALFDGMVDSGEAMSSKGSSSFQSSDIMPRVSQINLNYEVMENQLKATQGTLAVEQEEHRATRELLPAYHAQMQAYMAARIKNTFIAFITF